MESSGSGMPRPRFAEERTQIIRIFFLPDFTKMLEDVNEGTETAVTMDALVNFCDLFFNVTRTTAYDAKSIDLRLEPYISNHARLAEIGPLTAAQATVLHESLKLWVNAVIFFVFGFVIHELCRCLKIMFDAGKVRYLEEEIWVSFQWGVLINKTVLTKG